MDIMQDDQEVKNGNLQDRLEAARGLSSDEMIRSALAEAIDQLDEHDRTVIDAVDAEQLRCIRHIYGQCGSDNVAERTVAAIRKDRTFPSRDVWIVAYNHDHAEKSRVFDDPRKAVIDIARELEVIDVLQDRGADDRFWMDVQEAYNENGWKGLTVHRLDPENFRMSKMLPRALHFKIEELEEIPGFTAIAMQARA